MPFGETGGICEAETLQEDWVWLENSLGVAV